MNSSRKWLWVSTITVVLTLGVLAAFYSKAKHGSLLPQQLGQMTIGRHLSGDAAQKIINHLHGKGVTPRENVIGFYEGNGARATLYVSEYSDETDARDADRKMARLIRAGNAVFGNYEEVNFKEQLVSRCEGMGQFHYFFSRRNRLYWLEVDPVPAQEAMEDLLRYF